MFASTGGDRSIALYDLRSARPIRKLVMQTRTNAVAWNPMEAFNFTAASEDCNLYTYDMRKLQAAACVHKVGAACRPACVATKRLFTKARKQPMDIFSCARACSARACSK